ncbi:hypothetical protein F2Q69_00019893 [Brassica cretica]|uniref:RNA methyltransferase n=1 Tax=Brassica cretica TaxID=69181 RepID=A0A8S9Q581_BRACR|nr:hypothetical protein F2Q69_00019893 [Brassica cretica]
MGQDKDDLKKKKRKKRSRSNEKSVELVVANEAKQLQQQEQEKVIANEDNQKPKQQQQANQNPNKKKKKNQESFPFGNYKNYYGYRISNDMDEDPRLKVLKKEWFQGKDCLDIGCNSGVMTIHIGKYTTAMHHRAIVLRPEHFQEILLDKIGFRTVEDLTSSLSGVSKGFDRQILAFQK